MHKRQIISNKQVKLEIEVILNRKLFQNKVINRETYEDVQDELLKEINKELEKIQTYIKNIYIIIVPIKR